MRFDNTILITGGQADLPDPRVSPGTVPDSAIKESPKTLTGTDDQPPTCVLTLEGTAAQTVTVQPFVLDEATAGEGVVASARRFYSPGAGVVVTVGAITLVRAFPGKVYYRLTSAPAADAILKIGFKSGEPA